MNGMKGEKCKVCGKVKKWWMIVMSVRVFRHDCMRWNECETETVALDLDLDIKPEAGAGG